MNTIQKICRDCGAFDVLTDNKAEQMSMARQYIKAVRAPRSQQPTTSGRATRIYRKKQRGQSGNTLPSM